VKSDIPRVVEILLALGGLVVSSPLMILTAVLIRITSPGPIIFRQQRVGLSGKRFDLLKFRSMCVENEGPQVTARGDTRVTRMGQLLRKSKLDELPELWNVARGDLSLVGPRPEVPQYVNPEDPLWQKVLEACPGITDPVTLGLFNEEEVLAGCTGDPERFYLNTLQPYKLLGYVEYLRYRTWRSDVQVLIDTLIAIILPGKLKAQRVLVNFTIQDEEQSKKPCIDFPQRWNQS
jgi:lipopolysaccharide/colanic/teichoic acid biosynthesis glycosyltransferase